MGAILPYAKSWQQCDISSWQGGLQLKDTNTVSGFYSNNNGNSSNNNKESTSDSSNNNSLHAATVWQRSRPFVFPFMATLVGFCT